MVAKNPWTLARLCEEQWWSQIKPCTSNSHMQNPLAIRWQLAPSVLTAPASNIHVHVQINIVDAVGSQPKWKYDLTISIWALVWHEGIARVNYYGIGATPKRREERGEGGERERIGERRIFERRCYSSDVHLESDVSGDCNGAMAGRVPFNPPINFCREAR